MVVPPLPKAWDLIKTLNPTPATFGPSFLLMDLSEGWLQGAGKSTGVQERVCVQSWQSVEVGVGLACKLTDRFVPEVLEHTQVSFWDTLG